MLLRRVQESDTQDRLAAGRDADAVRMYGGDFRNLTPFTQEDAERWYQFEREQPFGWVMEVEGHFVGGARLHQLNLTDRRARFAIGIHAANLRSQGIGSEATRLVLRFAFEQLGLHRVDLRVLDFNHRAIACYAKCGFVREGLEREGAWGAGEWLNDVIMSVLEQEYRATSRSWD